MKLLDLTDYTMRDTVEAIKHHTEALLNGDDHLPCLTLALDKLKEQSQKNQGKVWLLSLAEYDRALQKLGLNHEEIVAQGITWKDLASHFTQEELENL